MLYQSPKYKEKHEHFATQELYRCTEINEKKEEPICGSGIWREIEENLAISLKKKKTQGSGG